MAIEKGLRVLISIFHGSPPALGRNIGEILIDIRDVTRLWGQRRLVFYVDCDIFLNKISRDKYSDFVFENFITIDRKNMWLIECLAYFMRNYWINE